jgi:hypothetical protein
MSALSMELGEGAEAACGVMDTSASMDADCIMITSLDGVLGLDDRKGCARTSLSEDPVGVEGSCASDCSAPLESVMERSSLLGASVIMG